MINESIVGWDQILEITKEVISQGEMTWVHYQGLVADLRGNTHGLRSRIEDWADDYDTKIKLIYDGRIGMDYTHRKRLRLIAIAPKS